VNNVIKRLIFQSEKATAAQASQIAAHAAAAPFVDALLEVEEPLWGGFWQGDVISPGYRLPAVEVALLRAVRLDKSWPPGTTPDAFLADLHRTILDPQAGLWTILVAGQPCVVVAGSATGERLNGRKLKVHNGSSKPETAKLQDTAGIERDRGKRTNNDEEREGKTKAVDEMITVAWYCASTGRLHAGYRVLARNFALPGAMAQRPLEKEEETGFRQPDQPDWIETAINQRNLSETADLAARLDLGILRVRSGRANQSR
jgi:hypothetical protein